MGKAALDGQPGVIEVLKAIRSSPFAEYNIVYYDPAATDADKLLTRLRAKGCPNASRVQPLTASAGGATLTLTSPVVVGGDWAWLTAEQPAGTLEVAGPNGWQLAGGRAAWSLAPGAAAAPVAVPRAAPQQNHQLALRLTQQGAEHQLAVTVSVVRRVP